MLERVGPPSQMGHAHQLPTPRRHRGEERIVALDHVPDGGDRHRPEAGDLAHLAFGGEASQQGVEIDPHDDLGRALASLACRPPTGPLVLGIGIDVGGGGGRAVALGPGDPVGHLGQGVGRVGVGRLVAGLGSGLSEDLVRHRVDGGHYAGAHFGVIAAVEMPLALGIGVGAQRPALVNAPAAGLGIDLGRCLGAGALLPQLGQWRAPGRLQQIVLSPGVGPRGVNDGRGLLRRQLAPAGGSRRRRQSVEPAGSLERGRRLRHAGARAPGQRMRRRAVALGPPRARFRNPRCGQGLDGGGDVLDPGRVLHHFLGLGHGEQCGVEAGGIATQRFPEFRDSHVHGKGPTVGPTTRGEATSELVFV